MNRKRFVIAFILLGATVLVALGTWQCLSYMVSKKTQKASIWESHSWSEFLALTEEQREKIEPKETKLKEKLTNIELALAKEEVILCRNLMTTKSANTKNLEQLQNKIHRLRGQKEMLVLNHMIQLKQHLTPAQQETLFTSLMQDICQSCKMATGSELEHCGLCKT